MSTVQAAISSEKDVLLSDTPQLQQRVQENSDGVPRTDTQHVSTLHAMTDFEEAVPLIDTQHISPVQPTIASIFIMSCRQ